VGFVLCSAAACATTLSASTALDAIEGAAARTTVSALLGWRGGGEGAIRRGSEEARTMERPAALAAACPSYLPRQALAAQRASPPFRPAAHPPPARAWAAARRGCRAAERASRIAVCAHRAAHKEGLLAAPSLSRQVGRQTGRQAGRRASTGVPIYPRTAKAASFFTSATCALYARLNSSSAPGPNSAALRVCVGHGWGGGVGVVSVRVVGRRRRTRGRAAALARSALRALAPSTCW